MKKITLLFVLLVNMTSFGQSKKELIKRSGDTEFLAKVQEKNKLKSTFHAYASCKLAALQPAIKLTDEQTQKFIGILNTQFPMFQEAQKKYLETNSTVSKIELMKLIVKSEEDFRKLLTPEQSTMYSSYGNKGTVNVSFDENFMTDETLIEYKKELL